MTVTGQGGDTAAGDLAARYGLADADLLAMHRTMALARALDERMWILNRSGRAPFVISGQGHEGAQVGIAWPLRRDHDWVAPYYRSIATCLVAGMTPRELMLAQFARASDPSSGGRQMPGHYGHTGHRVVSVSSPVATQILHAAGIALASRIRGLDQVAMAIMGEGSSNQGDVHEALNFAAIHRLPFVFAVENNGYAISVPWERELSVRDVADRASGYGIPGVVVDGPTLIEAKVTRLTGHSSDDQQTKYRSESDLAEGLAHDPLPIFRAQLRDAGVLDEAAEAALAAEISAAVEDATAFAEAEPDPDPATGMDHVFADPAANEPPPPWHPAPRASNGAPTGASSRDSVGGLG